jgi:hypothetical protein
MSGTTDQLRSGSYSRLQVFNADICLGCGVSFRQLRVVRHFD